jgi:CHASE3 domain sensor protein
MKNSSLTSKQLSAYLILFSSFFVMQAYLTYSLIAKKTSHRTTLDFINHTKATSTENLVNMLNVETSQRGYMLTNDTTYLEPYKIALKSQTDISNALLQTSLNTKSSYLLTQIETLSSKRLNFSTSVIQMVLQGKADSALVMMKSGRGKMLMDSIRALTNDLESEFNIQISDNELSESKSIYSLVSLLVATFVLQVAFTFYVVLWQNRSLEMAKQKQDRLDKILFMTYHDCKEPMRNIVSNLQLFEKRNSEKVDAEAKQFLEGTIAGVKQMQQTVLKLRNVVEEDNG